jgi:iron(III) transport system ATP-binding protein
MPDIVVDDLSLSFGDHRVLHQVSFVLHDREFLSLLGPSGCGKTTTLMSIAGFLRPDSGRIACEGQTFFDHAAHTYLAAEERNLGIVFQSYAIWPHMTVYGNVAFPLKVRKVKRDAQRRQVMETLDLVEMADYASRYPHELSGGQQQRVALARALVYSPTVLLLDEPFSNLDAKLRERARTWLMGLQRDLGLTTLFVTHDQDEALSLSDRVIVMNGGSILQTGSPEDVYRHPDDRFVAEFLGHCNVLTGRITSADHSSTTVELEKTGQLLTLPHIPGDPGRLVEIILRPEMIGLSELPPEPLEPNAYRATVRSRAFLGDHYVYELDLAGMSFTATHTQALTSEVLTMRIPADACQTISL